MSYVLGLDIGSSSIGWAIMGGSGGAPSHLINAGVCAFEAGVEGDLDRGAGQPRNLKRRQRRQQRRLLDRRARRMRKLLHLLQKPGLLPLGDAAAVALTDPAALHRLSETVVQAQREGRRWFSMRRAPWPGFLDEVRAAIAQIVVSHRVSRKLSSPLHEETNYSPPRDETGRPCEEGKYAHVRKPLSDLSRTALGEIVDPEVRRLTAFSGGRSGRRLRLSGFPRQT